MLQGNNVVTQKKYYPTKELVRGKHICWVPSLSVNYKLTHAQGHKWFIPLRNTRAYELHYLCLNIMHTLEMKFKLSIFLFRLNHRNNNRIIRDKMIMMDTFYWHKPHDTIPSWQCSLLSNISSLEGYNKYYYYLEIDIFYYILKDLHKCPYHFEYKFYVTTFASLYAFL